MYEFKELYTIDFSNVKYYMEVHPIIQKALMHCGIAFPNKGKIRKSGMGCISMINEHLYEGRYSPKFDCKRMARNVYAKTREECEENLAEMIREMKKAAKA